MPPSVVPVTIGSFFLTSLIVKYGLRWWREQSIKKQLTNCWSQSIPLQQEYFLQNRYQQVIEIADACLQLLDHIKTFATDELLLEMLELEFALRYQQYISKKQLLIDSIDDLNLLFACFEKTKQISSTDIKNLLLQQTLIHLQFTFNPSSLCETKETYDEAYQKVEKLISTLIKENWTFSTPWQQFLLEKCLEQRIIVGFSFEGIIKNMHKFQADLDSYLLHFSFLSPYFKSFLLFQKTNTAANFSELGTWVEKSLVLYPKHVDALFCKARTMISSLQEKKDLLHQILQINEQESQVLFYMAMEVETTRQLELLEQIASKSTPIHWESVESLLQHYLADSTMWSKIDPLVSQIKQRMKPREITNTFFWLAIKHVESVMTRKQLSRISKVVSEWMQEFTTHQQLLQDSEAALLETSEILTNYETIATQLLQVMKLYPTLQQIINTQEDSQEGFPVFVTESIKQELQKISIPKEEEHQDSFIHSLVFAFSLEEKNQESMQQKLSLVKVVKQMLQQNASKGLLPLVTELQTNAYGIVLIAYCKWKNIPLVSSSVDSTTTPSNQQEWIDKVEALIAVQRKKHQYEANQSLQQMMMQKLDPTLLQQLQQEEMEEEEMEDDNNPVIFNPEPLADILTLLDIKEKQEALDQPSPQQQ